MNIDIDEIINEFGLLISNYVKENTLLKLQINKLIIENETLKNQQIISSDDKSENIVDENDTTEIEKS